MLTVLDFEAMLVSTRGGGVVTLCYTYFFFCVLCSAVFFRVNSDCSTPKKSNFGM